MGHSVFREGGAESVYYTVGQREKPYTGLSEIYRLPLTEEVQIVTISVWATS